MCCPFHVADSLLSNGMRISCGLRLARPWLLGRVAARTPACQARGVTGQAVNCMRVLEGRVVICKTAPKSFAIHNSTALRALPRRIRGIDLTSSQDSCALGGFHDR
jgi:hypothetical protein